MTAVILLRHGLAEGIAPEAALLPEGEAQARAVAEHLAPWAEAGLAVVSSPLRRARETAGHLVARWGLAEPVTLPALVPEGGEGEARHALSALALAGPLVVVSHRPLLPRLAQRLAGVLAPFPTAGGLVLELDDWAPQGASLTYWLDSTGLQS
jgi:phosphohistidine phosphatase SixA